MQIASVSHRRRTMPPSRAGLTLLELVMVVSILAILTALVVPGMNDQSEETRKAVARATLQELRDMVANRYLQDMTDWPQPMQVLPTGSTGTLDTTRLAATQQVTGVATTALPQLHFLFVNPRQYASTSTPPYLSVSDYDHSTRVGWNGPYMMTKSSTYPLPTARRFPNDPNDARTWADMGFTTTFGQQGDFTLNDPWGSPYVIFIRQSAHGSSTAYTAYVVSAGFNRALDFTTWTLNVDNSLNTGDDTALAIKTWK